MKISEEFKQAISNLSDKEKDKLIFRLLKKDLPLTKRLNFELLQPTSIEEAREIALQDLIEILDYKKYFLFSRIRHDGFARS